MSKQTKFNNGECYSIQILVSRDLGLNPSFIPQAEKYLKSGSIEPSLIGRFATEAANMVSMINKGGYKNKAEKLANKYIPKVETDEEEIKAFCVYAKRPGDSKYSPVNITQNKIVTRLIKSTVILESYLNIAKDYIKDMKEENPDITLQIRKWKEKTVIYQQ